MAERNPGGRPPKLDAIVNTRAVLDDDGHPTGDRAPVTLIEQITNDLRAGMPVHRAAKRAGITSETFYSWEKSAGRARTMVASGQVAASRLKAYDRKCIEFSDRVNDAELEWELRQNVELERVARGGIVQTSTVVKVDANGVELERRTTTSTTLPDPHVLLARLKLRFPKSYSDRVVVAGDTESGAIPIEVRAASLADAAARFHDVDDESTGAEG